MNDETKQFCQVVQCGDTEIQWFLNNGWEILASAPNPFPQPYIYWFVSKVLPNQLTCDEVDSLLEKSRKWQS